jgi:hypothetical protein
MQHIDTLPAAASDTIATSTSPPPESLYDPFTGVAIGVLSPTSSAKNGGSGSSSEYLWVHLTHIHLLQADVAHLRPNMEGIGARDSVISHLRGDAPRAVGERLEGDENGDEDGGGPEAKKRHARQFE